MALEKEVFKQKMKEGREKAAAARAQAVTGIATAELPPVQPGTGGNGNGNGNGHHDEPAASTSTDLTVVKDVPVISDESILHPFDRSEGYSALKVFTDIGKAEDPEALLIRSDLPDKRTDGHVLVNMVTHAQDLYERFNYTRGKRRLRNVLAGYPAVNGKRIDVTLDAVIGERRQRRAEAGGFMGGASDWAKKQFQGSKPKGEDMQQ